VDLIETMRFEPTTGIVELEAHIQRMRDSADQLGISFDRHEARNQIQALCFDLEGPACVRLTASRGGALALEARPLPVAWPDPARAILLPLPVDTGDWRLRHKTTDRGFYDGARRAAEREDADEALFVRDDGLVTEGTITNVFVNRGGMLLTPPATLGLLPGVLRARLLAENKAREAALTIADLENGFLLGNALRGLMPARLKP
jgi:para-aminobenzoate synthetase/4-amino-4-deoxychorismate lyase